MTEEINRAFSDVLSEMGRPTTPRELERRGIKRLRSVGMGEISLLIERAVNRTLVERTLGGGSPEEIQSLAAAAVREFAREARGLKDLADSRAVLEEHRLRVKDELVRLRSELASRRGFVEQREGSASPRDLAELRDLRRRIEVCLGPLAGAGPFERDESGQLLAERVARDVLEILVEARAQALAEQRRGFDSELSLFERRVRKLVESLEAAEQALAALAAARAEDPGLASIYRTVQGLDPRERLFDRKRDLLERVFLENVELRRAAVE